MSEQEFNKIFSKNLIFYLDIHHKTQAELAKFVGVSTAAVNQWCKGIKTPRMDKVDKICKFLLIKRSDLIEEHSLDREQALAERTSTYATALLSKNPAYRKVIDSINILSISDMELLDELLKSYASLDLQGKKKLIERSHELEELGYTSKGDVNTAI